MSPQESVVYWVEYIICHKGVPHLKSHALNLTWYQYYLLNVNTVVSITDLIILLITYKVFKIMCNSCKKYLLSLKLKTY